MDPKRKRCSGGNKADGRKRTGKKENVVRNDPNPPGEASSAHR